MNIEQEREAFEAWALKERIAYRDEKYGVCFYNGERNSYWIGYQAGRAALQSQDREDAERYRWLCSMWQRADVRSDALLVTRCIDSVTALNSYIDARRIEGEGK